MALDKIAQRRPLFNKLKYGPMKKLREKLGPRGIGGKIVETFSPEVQKLMEVLRDVDDNIREESWDLKDILKQARTNFNRREFMVAIAFLGRFHDKLAKMDLELLRLEASIDLEHHQFLFGDIDPEHLDYLGNNLNLQHETFRTKKKAAAVPGMIAEAGVKDWWHNITTDRGRALRSWEKRFPKYVRDLKSQTGRILTRAEVLLSNLRTSFGEMATFRAHRRIEEYRKLAGKLRERYRLFHREFMEFYERYVKKHVEIQRTLKALNPDEAKPMVSSTDPAATENSAAKEEYDPLPPTGKIPAGLRTPVGITTEEGNSRADGYAKAQRVLENAKARSAKKREQEAKQQFPVEPEAGVFVDPAFIQQMQAPKPAAPTPTVEVAPPPAAEKEVVSTSPTPAAPPAAKSTPATPVVKTMPSEGVVPMAKTIKETPAQDFLGKLPKPLKPPGKKADHQVFLQSLAIKQDQHPMVLAKTILVYAETLDDEADVQERLRMLARQLLAT